ncbi:hypothetical protein JCM10908_003723 [Rhodotorula pacifica]|uniref:uncharacterized protein n=1 Tax=Rhodotorula pacifica TaxID=1495444 RepID=UPI0031701BFE
MAAGGHFFFAPSTAASRPSTHRPPSPSLSRPPSPARARSPVPVVVKPIPISKPTSAAPPSSRLHLAHQNLPKRPAEEPQASRESTLAQAIRHNDLRALVQNQERARSLARKPRPASPSTLREGSRARARVAIPSLVAGGVVGSASGGEEGGAGESETSGGSVDVPVSDMREQLRSSSSSRPALAVMTSHTGTAPTSPVLSLGVTSRLPPSTNRRLSSLATYTGVLPGHQDQQQQQQYPPPQQPVRSMSARAPSPELHYSLSLAGRRVSAPPAPRPVTTHRRSSSASGAHARPPSPAPPGFKTSSRIGSGGGGIEGFSPISPPKGEDQSYEGTGLARRASRASSIARARSPSPSVAPRGLVRAASPSPRSPPPPRPTAVPPTRARAPSPESIRHTASSTQDRLGGVTGGPLVVRGFDAPSTVLQIARPPSPAPSAAARSIRSAKTGRPHNSTQDGNSIAAAAAAAAGPIVRPRSSLLDRTADQRLEVRASRDFERIDEYYAARYAAAAVGLAGREDGIAAAPAAGGKSGSGRGSGREQRAEKRLAEERLRRGYDRMR